MALSCWSNPSDAAPLEGGITNFNIKLLDQGQAFVVRLGTDIPEHMVMRWNELNLSKTAHEIGLAPEVIHSELGVLVLRFVDASPLMAEDLHNEGTLMSVVDMVKKLHVDGTAQITGPVLSFWVFHILRTYARYLEENGSTHLEKLEELLSQASVLEAHVGPVSLVLGHNDLLPANILRGEDRYWLIDWEYGGLNSPLFDLGGLATNAGLDRAAEEAALTRYFGTPPSTDLWRSYGAMKCASLLRETMWSMVSEITSKLDFDYSDYTRENLESYRAAYAQYLSEVD
ncbi:MAG: choline/ethanolamine kinase family protein [Pseudomonadota bacterium]